MGKLAEYLKSEAETIRTEKQRRHAALQEWMDLLDGLFRRVDDWLKACDPEGLLEVTKETLVLNDPALGEYKAPSRRIRLGDRIAEVVPKARYIARIGIRPPGAEKAIRAHGLVELRESVGLVYSLLQVPGGIWYIQTEPQSLHGISENPVVPLDAERFEAALTSLLR